MSPLPRLVGDKQHLLRLRPEQTKQQEMQKELDKKRKNLNFPSND